MAQLTRIERARGCLLGMAIGDALGAPLEGLSTQQIRAHYGIVLDYVDGARAWKKKPFRWRTIQITVWLAGSGRQTLAAPIASPRRSRRGWFR